MNFRSDMTVRLVDHMGGDHSVIKAMLVSTTDVTRIELDEGASGRINFLMKNRHGTPFEHNAMAMGKAIVTLLHTLETAIDTYGSMPRPGVESGNIEPWE